MTRKFNQTIVCILFGCLFLSTNVFAQNELVTGYYDEQNDWFVFEWTDSELGKMSTIFDKENKVKPILNAIIEFDESKKTYTYNYELSNQEGAVQLLYSMVIDYFMPIYDVKMPSKAWYSDMYRNPPRFDDRGEWSWSKTNDEPFGIPAGETESGFSFNSKGLPGIVVVAFVGERRARFSGGGLSWEQEESFEKVFVALKEKYKDKLKTKTAKTIGPGKLPEKFNATDFIDHLIDLKHQAQELGWIKAEGGDGIIQALDQKLNNAKAAIARGNTRSATKILKAFIKQVEAQSCKTHDDCKKGKHLSPEAYALLKYNAEYLLENL